MSLVFAHNNLLYGSPTLMTSATYYSENATYPGTNAYNKRASTVYRTASSNLGQTYEYRVDFGAAVSIDFVAGINTNFRSTDLIAIQGDHDDTWPGGGDYSWQIPLGSGGLTTFGTDLGYYNFFYKLAATQTYRYWRFNWRDDLVHVNPDGFWQFGEIFFGTCVSLTSYLPSPYERGDDYHTVGHQTEWGNKWVYSRQNRLTYKINITNAPDSEITSLRTVFAAVQGDYAPFLFVPDTTAPFSLWGRFASPIMDETKRYNANDVSFTIEEDPRGINSP